MLHYLIICILIPIEILAQSNTLVLKYEVSKNQSQIILTFSNQINVTSNQLEQITAIYFPQQQNYAYKIYSEDNQTYQIDLNFSNQFYYSNCIIRFLAPYQIINLNSKEYLNQNYQTLYIQLGPYVIYSDFQQNTIYGLVISIYCLFILSLSSLIANIIYKSKNRQLNMSYNIFMFWQLLENLQISGLFYYFNTQLTLQMKDVTSYLRYFNFNFEMITIFNQYLSDFNYINQTFILWIYYVSSILIILIINLIKRKLNIQQFLLRTTSICILPFSLYGFLEIDYIKTQSTIEIINTTLVICSYVILTYYFVHYFFLLNYSQLLSQLNGLQTKAFFKRNFNLYQELKKLVFTSCIILLKNEQNICMTILVITQIITVTLLATKFPFKIRAINFIILWSEILMTLCLVLITSIVLLDYISITYLEEKTRDILGWSIISLFVGSIFIRSAGCLIELILNIQKL